MKQYMKWSKIGSSLALSMLFLAGIAQVPASAGTVLPPTTEEYNVIAVVKGVSSLVYDDPGQDATSRLSASCATKAHEEDFWNNWGNLLAKMGFSLHICWKGGQVVSKNWGPPWCWTDSFPDLWNCQNPDTYIEDQSGQNLPRNYIWRQYRFHLHNCVTWICKDKWPWVYIGGRGDGTFGVNGGLG